MIALVIKRGSGPGKCLYIHTQIGKKNAVKTDRDNKRKRHDENQNSYGLNET